MASPRTRRVLKELKVKDENSVSIRVDAKSVTEQQQQHVDLVDSSLIVIDPCEL